MLEPSLSFYFSACCFPVFLCSNCTSVELFMEFSICINDHMLFKQFPWFILITATLYSCAAEDCIGPFFVLFKSVIPPINFICSEYLISVIPNNCGLQALTYLLEKHYVKSNKSRNSTKKEASREKCGPGSVAKIGKSKRLVKTIHHGGRRCFVRFSYFMYVTCCRLTLFQTFIPCFRWF